MNDKGTATVLKSIADVYSDASRRYLDQAKGLRNSGNHEDGYRMERYAAENQAYADAFNDAAGECTSK